MMNSAKNLWKALISKLRLREMSLFANCINN